MDKNASSSARDRGVLFRETAAKKGLASAVVIEKDFWVCWILKLLFGLGTPPRLMFKGGTSLSKGYQLIERFSEDVDLTINRADLGFGEEKDPATVGGSNARQRALANLEQATVEHVSGELLPKIQAAARAILSHEHAFEVDAGDRQTILFTYPTALSKADYGGVSYITPTVRLELGSRSDHSPVTRVTITPYAGEEFGDHFDEPSYQVIALVPERTFWEKATILHAENHREVKEGTARKWERGSRHVYDIAMMARGGVADTALGSGLYLLEEVALHKSIFFEAKWARYDLAKPGTIRIVPQGDYEEHLRRDYREMEPMFFGPSQPSFDEVLVELAEIERRVNTEAGAVDP